MLTNKQGGNGLVAILFGKEGCKLCEAAGAKLTMLGIEYMKVDISMCQLVGWPALPAVVDERLEAELRGMLTEVMACYQFRETLPWIVLYDPAGGPVGSPQGSFRGPVGRSWEVFSYPEAIAELKRRHATSADF